MFISFSNINYTLALGQAQVLNAAIPGVGVYSFIYLPSYLSIYLSFFSPVFLSISSYMWRGMVNGTCKKFKDAATDFKSNVYLVHWNLN